MLGACLLQTPEDEEGDEGGESNPLLLECPPKLVDVHAMLGYKGVWKRDFLESCPPGFGSADPLSGVTAARWADRSESRDLFLSPWHWDHKHVPPHPAFFSFFFY